MVVDANISYNKKTYLLSQGFIILKNLEHQYIYRANSALNGRLFASIDLSTLDKGTYMINVLGGVKEGNDILNGALNSGYVSTGYKIIIRN